MLAEAQKALDEREARDRKALEDRLNRDQKALEERLNREQKALDDRVARDHKTLDDRMTRDHEVFLLRLGEESTRAVELFKLRLSLVGPLWRAIMGVSDASKRAFKGAKVVPDDVSVEAFEQAQMTDVRHALDTLIEVWDPASPIMKDVRADVEAMIEETNMTLARWNVARIEMKEAHEMPQSEDRGALLKGARGARRKASDWAREELPTKCGEILHKLTKFVDDRVAEVEAESAAQQLKTAQALDLKSDDLQK